MSITAEIDVPFGPTGKAVYERTYSRPKADGTKETWPETVARVATGNLSLVYGDPSTWSPKVNGEWDRLVKFMHRFAILPAGRHLWASGVKGRQFLFNCHVAGWGEELSRHFDFTFMRLMEGGGVGANYSSRFLEQYGAPRRALRVHIVCDPSHPDYAEMKAAGVLSEVYDSDWDGAFEVDDSREGWSAAMVDLIDTFMTDDRVKHADRVYDVSRVRSKGSRLKTFGGTASGPQPFGQMLITIANVLNGAELVRGTRPDHLSPTEAMEIDHAIAECVVSGGVRRSARMAICHWDDPFIQDFLACKQDSGKHWTTNISVEIDYEFEQALRDELHEKYEHARDVFEAAVVGMLSNGEPGFWNSTNSNIGEVNEVVATNPCLTGDTVIATVSGPRTFADLAEQGEDVEVYSWHPKSKLPVVRWMRRPHMTQRNAELLEVAFDSGLVVRCTPDHGFYSFRGKKLKASSLKVGQSIRAFSASVDGSHYERVHAWDSNRNAAVHQWTHRMIWENEHGPVPEGMVIAHLDGNATNNALSNLAAMSPYDHASYDYPKRQLAGFDGHSPNHKVVSVKPGGREDVYNGMVEDSHTYIVLDPNPVAGHMSGIVSANCGEIALEMWENCNLGHVNMEAFAPTRKGGPADMLGMIEAHRLVTRFLIRATYGDVQDAGQAEKLASNRRIGVGHFGVQGFFAKKGQRYSEAAHDPANHRLLHDLRTEVEMEARRYAFQLRIPEPVKTTTVAPTGTIAKMPGATEGIHPILFRHFERRVRYSLVDADQFQQVQDLVSQGHAFEIDSYDKSGNTGIVVFVTKEKLVAEVEAMGYDPDIVETAGEISLYDMLSFQEMYQLFYATNAVSFTANVPAEPHQQAALDDPANREALAWGTFKMPPPTPDRVAETMQVLEHFLPTLKGTTLMLDGARPQAPYTKITEAEYDLAIAKSVADGIDENCATGACPVR